VEWTLFWAECNLWSLPGSDGPASEVVPRHTEIVKNRQADVSLCCLRACAQAWASRPVRPGSRSCPAAHDAAARA